MSVTEVAGYIFRQTQLGTAVAAFLSIGYDGSASVTISYLLHSGNRGPYQLFQPGAKCWLFPANPIRRAQTSLVVRYSSFDREDTLKSDVLVNSCLLVEVKAVETVRPIHKAQLLSYMRLLDITLGPLINFHVERLTESVSRLIVPGANLRQ